MSGSSIESPEALALALALLGGLQAAAELELALSARRRRLSPAVTAARFGRRRPLGLRASQAAVSARNASSSSGLGWSSCREGVIVGASECTLSPSSGESPGVEGFECRGSLALR